MNLTKVLSTRSIPVLDLAALLDQLEPATEVKFGAVTLTIDGLRQALGGPSKAVARRLTAEERAAIAAEPKGTSSSALARRYNTSLQTIKKHRQS